MNAGEDIPSTTAATKNRRGASPCPDSTSSNRIIKIPVRLSQTLPRGSSLSAGAKQDISLVRNDLTAATFGLCLLTTAGKCTLLVLLVTFLFIPVEHLFIFVLCTAASQEDEFRRRHEELVAQQRREAQNVMRRLEEANHLIKKRDVESAMVGF